MRSSKKTVYVCQACGSQFPKWMGKCTQCNAWESLVEEIPLDANKERSSLSAGLPPLPLKKIEKEAAQRYHTGNAEFDHLLGGGIVPGALILVGGEPGIGKSTLLLQISNALAREKKQVLYISGEESVNQVKLRAERLNTENAHLLLYAENNFSRIKHEIERIKPSVAVIDSIQTVYQPDLPSAPGSVGQVRECAAAVMHLAKSLNLAIFLIGHVTREGSIAGPKVLEHIVDTVLYFEGDKNNTHRILRVIKNRFGATNEIAIYEMKNRGLVEVLNPSEIFLSERREGAVGSIVTCAMEGTRPLLIEIQALVSKMSFNYPQRISTGIDQKRLSLICAVLERLADYPLSTHDIFLNITGGIKVEEPAADLPVACAIVSSLLNRPIDRKLCAMGEIGLSGEIRSVNFLENRVREAQKLGFNRIMISRNNAKKMPANPALTIMGSGDIAEAVENLF